MSLGKIRSSGELLHKRVPINSDCIEFIFKKDFKYFPIKNILAKVLFLEWGYSLVIEHFPPMCRSQAYYVLVPSLLCAGPRTSKKKKLLFCITWSRTKKVCAGKLWKFPWGVSLISYQWLLKLFNFYCCACVCVIVYMWVQVPLEGRRGCQMPWSCRYKCLWAAKQGCWNLISDPVEGQQVLLTTELPL